MNKHHKMTLLSGAALLLLGGPALANHCATDLSAVQTRLSQPTAASTNALEAAAALVETAIPACEREEAELASAPADSPMRQPGYATLGQAMLINALQLVDVR